MKLFTIALSALALCGAAFAAPIDTFTARFTTPVTVGEKALPAGEVTFNVIHGTSSTLLVARTANNDAAMIVVNRVYEPEQAGKSEVTLNKTGNTLKVEKVTVDGISYTVADAQ
jgi:hypothetical protein